MPPADQKLAALLLSLDIDAARFVAAACAGDPNGETLFFMALDPVKLTWDLFSRTTCHSTSLRTEWLILVPYPTSFTDT